MADDEDNVAQEEGSELSGEATEGGSEELEAGPASSDDGREESGAAGALEFDEEFDDGTESDRGSAQLSDEG